MRPAAARHIASVDAPPDIIAGRLHDAAFRALPHQAPNARTRRRTDRRGGCTGCGRGSLARSAGSRIRRGAPPHRGHRGRLRLVRDLPGLPPLAVPDVAWIVPPHDDADRHPRIRARRLRRRRGGRGTRRSAAARAPRRRVLGGVRRSRLGGRPARPTAHHPAGGDDHRLAPPEHLLVLDRARASPQRAARGLPARREALDAPQRRRAGAAGTGGGDARRALERRLHRLPHDARQDPLRHPVSLRADPRSIGRHHRRRARHRLRGMPRTGRRARRRQPEPVAALRAPRRRRARRDHRRADAPRPAALVAGLRPVPQHLGVPRLDGRARGQRRRPAVPARRRVAGDPLRRPAAG